MPLTTIPPNYKIPGANIQVDPSQAGTPTNPKYALAVGYKTASGTATSNTIVAVGTQADANTFFGAGSMLARMFAAFFAINRATPFYALVLDAPSAGVAASGAITVTAAPTASGTVYLYIAGQRLAIAVLSTDTQANVATKIGAAINAATDLPVTASVSTNAVTVTAKHKGIVGNDIRVEDSYLGFFGGEVLPAGLAITYPTSNVLANGTGVPDYTTAITQLGDTPFKFVALPFTDTGSTTTFDTEFGFTDSGRWGPYRQSYGQAWSAKRDTYANLMVWGPTQNSAVISVMALELASPTPIWEWSAAYMAIAALALTADPARPLQTLQLTGLLPAPKASRFNKFQLNALAQNGLAIQATDLDGNTGGVPQILREQTLYQRNTTGQADNAFELATTLATLDEVFTRLRQSISNKYPRHKLANDGTAFSTGQAIVTPKIIKGQIIADLRLMEADGLVENVQASKDALVVQRANEPNTVEVLFPPDLINQLRRLNILGQFRLQFPITLAA